MNIMYLCDGEKPDCKKRTCYKNGGYCRHTKSVEYAVNFSRKGPVNHSTFWEEKISRDRMEKEIEDLRKNMKKIQCAAAIMFTLTATAILYLLNNRYADGLISISPMSSSSYKMFI
jgi:transcriptional/translational regulatory protein YebC/TACO1